MKTTRREGQGKNSADYVSWKSPAVLRFVSSAAFAGTKRVFFPGGDVASSFLPSCFASSKS